MFEGVFDREVNMVVAITSSESVLRCDIFVGENARIQIGDIKEIFFFLLD